MVVKRREEMERSRRTRFMVSAAFTTSWRSWLALHEASRALHVGRRRTLKEALGQSGYGFAPLGEAL
jgi:hypothetical protein